MDLILLHFVSIAPCCMGWETDPTVCKVLITSYIATDTKSLFICSLLYIEIKGCSWVKCLLPYLALPCSVYPQCHNPLYEATDFNRFIKFSLFLLLNIYELSGKRYNDIMECTTWPIITYSHWKRRLQNHSQTSQPLIGENCVLIKKNLHNIKLHI